MRYAWPALIAFSATIRAFAAEQRYQDRFYQKVNAMLKLSWAYSMIRRWIRLRMDLIATSINALTFALIIVSGIPQGLAAIAIVWCQYIVSSSLELVNMVCQACWADFCLS
jgi:hypothetical protein